MKQRELIKKLQNAGFEFYRHGSNHCSEATIPRGFSQENPEFSKQKSICEANCAWIFALYLEGTEQIPMKNKYHGIER